MNMNNLVRGDLLGYCEVCECMRFDVLEATESWRNWEYVMVCGGCRQTEEIQLIKMEKVIDEVMMSEAEWQTNHCECNGGNPCNCPDCDHQDCVYKSAEDHIF